jgi:hypothetical protein
VLSRFEFDDDMVCSVPAPTASASSPAPPAVDDRADDIHDGHAMMSRHGLDCATDACMRQCCVLCRQSFCYCSTIWDVLLDC